MNKKTKVLALCLALFMTMLMLVSCGSTTLRKLEPQEGVQKVELDGFCSLEVQDGVLRINFSGNLQNGAIVRFTVDDYQGKELAAKEYAVSAENIYAEFEIDPSWSGIVYGTVQCSPQVGSQPDEVEELYGKYFQNIDGDHVIWNEKNNIFIVQSDKVDLG